MKKRRSGNGKLIKILTVSLLFSAVILSGCGQSKPDKRLREGMYFLMRTMETLPYASPAGQDGTWLQTGEQTEVKLDKKWRRIGVQYENGELLQIFGVYDSYTTINVLLCHEDGNCDTLAEGLPSVYRSSTWFMDREGNFYLISGKGITKLDKAGNKLYEKPGIWFFDICQLSDGRLMAVIQADEKRQLAEVDGTNGTVTPKALEVSRGGNTYIESWEDKLIMLDDEGLWEVDPGERSKTPLIDFNNASYRLPSYLNGFRMLADNSVEFWNDENIERLESIDISLEREIVVLRDWRIDDTFKSCAYEFNQTSEDYYVVMEECDDNMDITQFRERTGIDIATGMGADIICSDAMTNNWNYVAGGLLEDLSPYMERSGVTEEAYFPSAFRSWNKDGKVYGINLSLLPTGIWMSEELLGGREVPDVETLVQKMLEYDGDKKWLWDSSWILHYLIRGSEDMWGLIDWEKGSCDFTGELFTNMLRAAKKHGGDYSREDCLADWVDYGYEAENSPEYMEQEKKVPVGFLFDNGAHPLTNEYDTIGISSSSSCKEGAWEFIRLMLGETPQMKVVTQHTVLHGAGPANRAAFARLAAQTEAAVSSKKIGTTRNGVPVVYDINRRAAVIATLEDARFAPINTTDIQDIILMEADAYFCGDKSVEEVCKVIQNKAQLYLDEHR